MLSVTAHKNLKMRGQAFIAFENEKKAKEAVAILDGVELFQKTIHAELAKSSSNATIEKNLDKEKYDAYLEERSKYKKALDEKKEVEKKQKPTKVNLDNTPPNKILLIQDLPADTTREDLSEVFSKHVGFVEIRLVAVRRVAFVEFESEKTAIPAKEQNQGLTIREQKVSVNYAKK